MNKTTYTGTAQALQDRDIAYFGAFEAEIKRHALFFDSVAVPFLFRDLALGSYHYRLREPELLKNRFAAADYSWAFAGIEWMIEHGVLIDADDHLMNLYQSTPFSPDQPVKEREILDVFNSLKQDESEWIQRLLACWLRSVFGHHAAPIVSGYDAFSLPPPTAAAGPRDAIQTRDSEALRLVVGNLPTPHPDTPWEKILDFRSDPATQYWLQRLRMWVSKTVNPDVSSAAIQEELEWLLQSYRKHYSLHKMQYRLDCLQQLLKAPLGLLEDLVKLRWSKIPEPLMTIGTLRVKFLREELSLPGSDVAYIEKARDSFVVPKYPAR